MSDMLFVVAMLAAFAGCLVVIRVLNLRDARTDLRSDPVRTEPRAVQNPTG
ncbi:hypothetical protein ACQI4L_03570 [Mycolicibacterium litorale]|uniref:hypothetical protein n=1 Tax=Mycolicibacterium litorale TaxID=758802 RepID=UPI003CFA5E4A